jgi:hypothetical protein
VLKDEIKKILIGVVERAFTEAGFRLLKRDDITSEWREHDIESGSHTVVQSHRHALHEAAATRPRGVSKN